MTRKENAPVKGRGNCVADVHNTTANMTAIQCRHGAVIRFVYGKIVEDLQGRDVPARLDYLLARFKKQGFTRAETMKAINCLIDSGVARLDSITVTEWLNITHKSEI